MPSPDAGLPFRFSSQTPDNLTEYLLWLLAGATGLAQGPLRAFPADAEEGTVLPNRPDMTSGVRLEIPADGSVSFFIRSGGVVEESPIILTRAPGTCDEPLSIGDEMFVTAASAGSSFRWIRR